MLLVRPGTKPSHVVPSCHLPNALFLCVDCGGSKTSAVITNHNGDINGRALGGPSNFAYMSAPDFERAVRAAVSSALKTCLSPPSTDLVPLTIPQGTFGSAWFGISGVDSRATLLLPSPLS